MQKYEYTQQIPYTMEIGGGREKESYVTPKWVVEQICDAMPSQIPIRDGMAVAFSYSQSNRLGNYYSLYCPEIGKWECHGGSASSAGFAGKSSGTQLSTTQVCGWTIISID